MRMVLTEIVECQFQYHIALMLVVKLLKEEVINREIHLIFGSCIFEEEAWYNAAICYSYNNPNFIYKKLNLAFHERGYLKQGD
jgi:hypothetical protein